MRSHFYFGLLIVRPQDVLSAAAGEERKWGQNTEWKLKSDHRDGVVSDKLWIISSFIWILLCTFLYNSGVCTIWQFVLLLRSLKMTQMTVQLCDSILCDCTVMLDRVHFWITTASLFVCWVSYLREMARFWQRSLKIPHSSFTSSFSQLHTLRLAVAACGTKDGFPKWNAHLWKTLAFTWGNIFYISCWNKRFLRVHTYVYAYDSEQTLVILPKECVGGVIGRSPRILVTDIIKFAIFPVKIPIS
jgi:hypothetical protein